MLIALKLQSWDFVPRLYSTINNRSYRMQEYIKWDSTWQKGYKLKQLASSLLREIGQLTCDLSFKSFKNGHCTMDRLLEMRNFAWRVLLSDSKPVASAIVTGVSSKSDTVLGPVCRQEKKHNSSLCHWLSSSRRADSSSLRRYLFLFICFCAPVPLPHP